MSSHFSFQESHAKTGKRILMLVGWRAPTSISLNNSSLNKVAMLKLKLQKLDEFFSGVKSNIQC
jgi:hypothetical protein